MMSNEALHLESFTNILQNLVSNFEHQKYLIAVSGGLDSMVLLHLMHQLNLDVSVVHCNYQLRAEDSEKDEKLVEIKTFQYQLPFFSKRFEVEKSKPNRTSIQMHCRDLRYAYFKELKERFPYDYLVTAHHADDQLESLFLNLNRAGGINSLKGIVKNNNGILRPLLDFSKKELKQYAISNDVEWREDVSNQKTIYDRNYFRNEIIPKIDIRFPDFRENSLQTISYLSEVHQYIEKQIEVEKANLFENYKEGIKISISKLKTKENFILLQLFKDFGFLSATEIHKMLEAQTGSKFESAHYQVFIDRDFLYIFSSNNLNFKQKIIPIPTLPFEQTQPFPLKIEKTSSKNSRATLHLDADKITFPLYLRTRKEGDEFFPKNFDGSKKLSKFFKDKKIPIFEKDRIWLLTDKNDAIIYVIPYRSDRRFSTNNKTKNYLNIYL